MTAADTLGQQIEQLNTKVDAVIDHTATQIGKLEERASKLESMSSEHFGLVETRLNATSDVLERMGDRMVELDSPAVPTELYKALVAAQSDIRNADQNVNNEFTNKKYADLASVMNAVRGPLSDKGLAIFQVTATIEEVATVDTNPAAIGIKTTLVHESGESIVDITAMCPPKNDPQGIGSCRTYMRRYAVLAICAIAGAADDDAERTKARLQPSEVEKILYHADELFGSEHADDAIELMIKNVFSDAEAKVIGDIPAGQLDVAINYLNRAKTKRDKQIAENKKAEKAAAKAAKE